MLSRRFLRHSHGGTVIAENVTVTGVLTNSGIIRGTGRINGQLNNSAGGELRVGSGDQLLLTAAGNTNAGRIEVIDGEIEFTQGLTNAASTGLITGEDATFRFGGRLTNDGAVALSFGTSRLFGDMTNTATGNIAVAGNSQATFYDDVANGGVLNVATGSTAVFFGALSGNVGGGDVQTLGDLAPGASPGLMAFGGNLVFGALSTLETEITGTVAGSEFDQVNVAGTASLGGMLDLVGIESLSSMGDATLEILNALSVSGTFAGVPDLNDGAGAGHLGTGIFFEDINYNPTNVTIDILQAATGDLNGDRQVDNVDILNILAANSFGNPGAGPGLGGAWGWAHGDNNGDGLVDNTDILNILAANLFGTGAYAALPVNASVPEPSSLTLAVVGLLGLMTCSRRRPTSASLFRRRFGLTRCAAQDNVSSFLPFFS